MFCIVIQLFVLRHVSNVLDGITPVVRHFADDLYCKAAV
jgi:hypothetical protein